METQAQEAPAKTENSESSSTSSRLLPLGKVLRKLGIGYQTYSKLRKEGRWMPELRLNQRRILIDSQDVETWLAKQKQG